MNLAWLELGEGEASCPEIPTGQLGKLLALSFWEDFAILDQMMAYIPTVSWLCAIPAPPNTLPTRVHTYRHLALSSTLCCPESQPWLCGPTVWQEHSGPVELERSLDLNYQLYLVRREHSQKGQCPTCSSLLVVFCSWAMGGGPLESLSVPADSGILLGSQQRHSGGLLSSIALPSNLSPSFKWGWAVVEEISVLIRVYRNHCTK